jgi:hypothetical protein
MQKEALEKLFVGEGFVYWEIKNSPDGALHILNGCSEGEKSPTLNEPRVIDATTGETVFNLWHSYQNYELHFGEPGHAVLTIQNHHKNQTRSVELNFRERTFAFQDEPRRLYSLSVLVAKSSLF